MQNIRKKKLTENIEKLRTNFEENHIKIRQAERELGKILDSELRDKLQELKIFEILQAEKANDHFLEIAKKQPLSKI